MKTLIKLNRLELISSANQLFILQAGTCKAKYPIDQLFPAIANFLYLSKTDKHKLSKNIINSFQPDLF
jgi:hypothetical protein